ncbi:MAG TPA: restriction endonuclease [Candidatus Enterenecus merdae]|nr:restriction endonuclease [Candidatus Enterenecus merdae]
MADQKAPGSGTRRRLPGILRIPLAVFLPVRWIVKGIVYLYRSKPLTLVSANVDGMDGVEFERFVAGLLRRNGYADVELTRASGDYGVDVIAQRDGLRYAIQCKRYSGHLGVKAVQEVYAGARMYEADVCAVATNSFFTAAAQTLAEELGVLLWDRQELERMTW